MVGLVILSALSFLALEAQAEEINKPTYFVYVVTENFPPYNYVDENREVVGYATEIVRKCLSKAGIEYEIEVLPWARAFKSAKTQKNYLLYSASRTVKREPWFEWVGPVSKPTKISFYKLKGNKDVKLNIQSELNEAKKHYIGVMNGSSYHDYLIQHKFPFISNVPTYNQTLIMLARGRIDLIFMGEPIFDKFFSEGKEKKILAKMGVKKELFQKVFSPWSVSEYMTFNKDSDPVIVQKVRKAYKKLASKGEIIPH